MKNILALIVSLVLCGAAIAQDTDTQTAPNNNNISTESPATTPTDPSEADVNATTETNAASADASSDTADVTEAEDTSPVVLELGERSMTQQQFEERFLVFASNYLAQRGVQPSPENLVQMEAAKVDYIQNLMTDMVLLDEAAQRGIEADTTIVEEQLTEIKNNIPEDVGFDDMLTAAGFKSESQLRTLMAEVTVIEQLIEQIVEENEVSDEALQTFYDENSERFARPAQVCARHILLDSEEDANAVLAELEEGGDFAELASEHSTGPSASRGGDLECFAQEQMVPEFAEAAFAADIDNPVGPVQTDFGYHLILVYDKKEAGLVELEEVAEPIREELTNRAISEYIEGLVSNSEVSVNSEFLASLQPTPSTDAPVMDNSGNAPAPEGDADADATTDATSEDATDAEDAASEDASSDADSTESTDTSSDSDSDADSDTDNDSNTDGNDDTSNTDG